MSSVRLSGCCISDYILRNRKRLLHPGADTRLILTQYVSIIKCLRLVDPVGVLLYKVADPIRRYLRCALLASCIYVLS